MLRIFIKGFCRIRSEIPYIQFTRPQAETVQSIGILEDTIQQNTVLLLCQCRFA